MNWRRTLTAASLGLFAMAATVLGGSPATISAPSKVYELRVYHCNPGKLDALLKRFREHTIGLFEKHGMTNIGYWIPADDDKGKADTLIYLLAHDSREKAKASWDAFSNDPDWQKAKAESEKDGVKLAAKVDVIFLNETDYTPDTSKPGAAKGPLTYELRTYTTSPGKLDNLNKRFREHTMKLFEKHGMINVGYWTPSDEDKGKANTLIYLMAHKDREAANKSWGAFGSDPEWQKVYKESQPDNIPLAAKVESVYLIPTDFSRLK